MTAPLPKPPSSTAATREQVSAMRARDVRGRRTMAVLHAALVDLIEERPFDRITVDDITTRSGVGRSTFYRHYADKQALLEEVARGEISSLVSVAIANFDKRDSLPACRKVAGYVDERRRLWSVLLTGGAAGAVRQKFIELTTPDPGSPRAIPEHDVPAGLSASLGVAATVEVLAWWLRDAEGTDVDRVADYINRLAVRPSLDQPTR